MYQAQAYSAASATAPLAQDTIPRRANTDSDVQIDILFCGVCHSDVHLARDEWKDAMPAVYPVVPGHEIIGRVTEVGSAVSKHKVGDIVGVGCMVDSDRDCPMCQQQLEQHCASMILTYNSPDKHGTAPVTYGGYSTSVVVDEHFVLSVPDGLDLAGAAPLLCAGITTYSPIKRWSLKPGQKVGVVGLGGLGHMGVKFAKAFGAEVAVFTRSANKTDDARRLGADHVIVSTDDAEMAKHMGTFDFILDTVSANHDINVYINQLGVGGALTMVGVPDKPLEVAGFGLLFGRRRLEGSIIGGIAETQEMLDFCAEKNIVSDVEIIPIQKINEAWERMLKSDVKYRFCIDMASLKGASSA